MSWIMECSCIRLERSVSYMSNSSRISARLNPSRLPAG